MTPGVWGGTRPGKDGEGTMTQKKKNLFNNIYRYHMLCYIPYKYLSFLH